MKKLKELKKRENIWLSCIVIGPLTAFFAVFNPAFSVLAIIFMIIGIKGVLVDIM
jgi:hypothetical protein